MAFSDDCFRCFTLVVGLAFTTLFIPRKFLVKINLEAVSNSILGLRFILLKPIHHVPFWTLNRFGKALRVSMDLSLFLGLVVINISYWFT